MKKRLVLFDFDGTITTKDTFLEFIKFYHGSVRFFAGFLFVSPWIILMILKLYPNYKAKEKVLSWFFKGQPLDIFKQKCNEFCISIVPKLVRPKALAEIRDHQLAGAKVIVVSASAENWVQPWCESQNLDCIATKLEVVNHTVTGRISGVNCYGPEKESRIRECHDLTQFDEIVAYGDSSGDVEMLALAQQRHYRPFRS